MHCLFCIIFCRKCALATSLKDKNGITVTNAFQRFLDESGRKPNKTWVDKCSGFYNKLMKAWLEDSDTEIHLTYNKGSFFVAE